MGSGSYGEVWIAKHTDGGEVSYVAVKLEI